MPRFLLQRLDETLAIDALSIRDFLTARSLGVTLWLGLALLTLSLLILMRTRWGQARPLSKCVVLSIFAHLLLLGYAYGTRLILEPPPPVAEEVFDLAFVSIDQDDAEPLKAESPTKEADWDRLAADAGARPDVDALARAEPVVLPTPERSQNDAPPLLDDQPLPDPLAPAEPARPLPAVPDEQTLQPKTPGAEPTPIEAPQPSHYAEAEMVQPGGAPLERLQPVSSDAEPLERSMAADLPSELVDAGARLQRLADVPAQSQIGDTLAAQRDTTDQSANDGAASLQGDRRPGETAGDADQSRQQLTAVALRDARPGGPQGALGENTISPSGLRAASGSRPAAPVRRLGDGQPVPDVYAGRMSDQKQTTLQQFGGSDRTESAVEAALAWLAANQSHDGRWDPRAFGGGQETKTYGHDRQGAGANADTGITALALLALLGNGHTHLEGQYRKNVQLGLELLLRQQRDDGCLAGNARLFASMYCHGMAALALSEAYALTGDYRLKPYVERAVQFTVDAQHQGSGGWRYQPGDRGDTSQFGWQVMALRSAELAGIPLAPDTRHGMVRFLQSVSSGPHGGLASYRPGERPSPSMTAEALSCRFFLGLIEDERLVREAATVLLDQPPSSGETNLYYWYYATLAMFQLQDHSWRQWNAALQDQLLALQRTDGVSAGSWDPQTVWGSYGGRVYSTAMATLCLEVYYRYLPLYQAGR